MKELKLSNINPYTILMDILYSFWVIVLAFLIGFWGAKTYYGYVYKPTYKSSTTVAVNVRDTNGYITSNITKTIEIAEVFQNIFKSDVMAKVINEQVNDFNMANVSAQVVPETNLITITAVSSAPVDSYKTLVAVLDNYNDVFAENVFEDIYINVLTKPAVPTSPNNSVSGSRKAILIGLVMSAVCTFLIAAFSYLRDTVKQQSDIERYVDGTLFGTVYHEKPNRQMVAVSKKNKQPIRLNILNPFCSYAFVEGINRVSTKVEYLKSSRGAKSFLITSVDEHEGKTTISTNIALNLAKKGFKTILVDIDLRRPSVYKSFSPELNTSYNEIGNYILEKAEFEDIIKQDKASGLYLIDGKNSYQYAFELLGS
ncbi:MAG: AAA family ATPase, partial [Acutalibacteraceae bacterium]